ncbi:uncharacterized protein LOC142324566 [Lycorma delicatula]|uniref:uncharacterized protein LOC142324566 n=1 Tax=Lycorma delicatula TaxID=130591 RepID=UPI003F5177AA
MDVPVKNIYVYEALPSNSIKLESEDDTTKETLLLILPHRLIEDDITPVCESEILLNDDVSPQVNLNMKSNELRIKDFRTVKTKDGMVFYPCRLTNGNSELWYLSKSKNRLLLARRTEDIFHHFKTAITAWKDINRIENSKDLSLKLSWHCHITEICKDIFSWIKQNPPIQWSELENYHHEEKVWLLEKTLLQNCDRYIKTSLWDMLIGIIFIFCRNYVKELILFYL